MGPPVPAENTPKAASSFINMTDPQPGREVAFTLRGQESEHGLHDQLSPVTHSPTPRPTARGANGGRMDQTGPELGRVQRREGKQMTISPGETNLPSRQGKEDCPHPERARPGTGRKFPRERDSGANL